MNKTDLREITKEEFEKMDWEANSWYCREHNKYWYASDRFPIYCNDCKLEKENPNKIIPMTEKMIKQLEECENLKEQERLDRFKKAKHSYQLLKVKCEDCVCNFSLYKRLEDSDENAAAFILGAALRDITKEEFKKYNVILELTCVNCGNKSITSISSTDFLELESEKRNKHIKKLKLENLNLQENIKRLNKEIAETEKRIRLLDAEELGE